MSIFKVPPSSISFLRNLVLSNKIASPLVSMAAGRVIAHHTPIPPMKIEMPLVFFAENSEAAQYNFLDAIHDIVPINHRAILEYSKKFWQIRNCVAHGGPGLSYTGSDGVYNLYHVGVHLSPNDLELLEDNSQEFGGLVAGFETIYLNAVAAKLPGTVN